MDLDTDNRAEGDLSREVDQALLSFYAPAALVLTRQLRVLERRGDLSRFGLPKRFTRVPAGVVGDAVRRAVDSAAECDCSCSENLADIACVTAAPIAASSRRKRPFLVVFQAVADAGSERVRELETQLTATRQYLATALDDYESTTEELHSAHEELQCANEELQQLNHDLQTANDHLGQLNSATEARLRELQRANSELASLFNSVGIPMMMLGQDLRIRRFNPQAERFFNLKAADVGKPIREVRPSVNFPYLEEVCMDVLDTFSVRSRHVQDSQGRNLSLVLRPLRTPENKIDGVIITLLESPARATSTG
jgi:two-component system CheB/CheR fusion protein